jgi:hypothetical protein
MKDLFGKILVGIATVMSITIKIMGPISSMPTPCNWKSPYEKEVDKKEVDKKEGDVK